MSIILEYDCGCKYEVALENNSEDAAPQPRVQREGWAVNKLCNDHDMRLRKGLQTY